MHHRRGHQWFTTEGNPLAPERILAAQQVFDALIKDVARREGFEEVHDRVALTGISHGALMGLDAVANGRWKIGSVVAFSGLLPPQPILSLSRTTPILLVHGQADTTIPATASTLAASQLGTARFEVEVDVKLGTRHTISSSGAARVLAVLKRKLQ
ncbi:alpha/beta hydrolase [Rhizobium populisoli]|uniref:alpha/beta hydrolase n=1 Tax=Rhizobium populisoli TaxID=2859785 RepID=UPI001FE9B55E|nr:dienelactone hydrolase family protein [Rhizobium populisoli]